MSTFTDILSTIGVIGVVAAFVGTLLVLMERTHRRTQHLSRGPFGADLEGDSDIRRTLDELRAVRSRQRRTASWQRVDARTTSNDAQTHRTAHRAPRTLRHV